MKKTKISTYFLLISIFTFIAIFIFVVQNSYNHLMKPINQVQTNNSLKPIDPNLDISVLDQIAKRQYFSPDITVPPATGSSLAQ
jgi:hypothetical protein